MFDGIDMTKVRFGLAGLTWDYVDRLKSATKMKVLLKGIQTREDGLSIDQIVAITFTNRAANEMRERLRANLHHMLRIAGNDPRRPVLDVPLGLTVTGAPGGDKDIHMAAGEFGQGHVEAPTKMTVRRSLLSSLNSSYSESGGGSSDGGSMIAGVDPTMAPRG